MRQQCLREIASTQQISRILQILSPAQLHKKDTKISLCQLKSGVFQCKRQSLWRLSFQESIKLKTYQNNIDCRDELKSRVFSCLMITSEMFSWFALIIFFRSFAWLFAEHLSLNPSPPFPSKPPSSESANSLSVVFNWNWLWNADGRWTLDGKEKELTIIGLLMFYFFNWFFPWNKDLRPQVV